MSSVYRAIMEAVKTEISSLTLTGFSLVVVRKKPHAATSDPPGFIVVSPGAESIAEEYTENTLNIEYPVFVTFVQQDEVGVPNIQAVNNLLDAREYVRRALHKPYLTGVSSVIDSRVAMNRAFDPFLFPQNYDASQMIFTFKSTEDRDDD